MSSVKGIPSVSKVKEGREVYKAMSDVKNVEKICSYNGKLKVEDNSLFYTVSANFGQKRISKEEAMNQLVEGFKANHTR